MRRSVLYVGNYMHSSKGSRAVSFDIGDRLAESGWTVLRTSSVGNKALRLADMVTTAWRRRDDYDVAHIDVFSGSAFMYAETMLEAVLRLGKPVVLTLHGGGLPDFAKLHPRRVTRLLRKASLVTAPSGYLKAALEKFRPDIQLVPNPLPVDRYKYRLRAQPAPRLIWLRAIHKVYNPAMAVRTAALLWEEFPDLKLLLYGPDKGDGCMEDLRQALEQVNAGPRVELAGWVAKDSVPDVLDRADIFLNTTNTDNTPLSVLEAMASGLCVVSTNVGGLPYLIDDGRDGLLVPPNDPSAAAKAVRNILKEHDLGARLSENARLKAERFDWSRVLPMWDAGFLEAIDRYRGDACPPALGVGTPEVEP